MIDVKYDRETETWVGLDEQTGVVSSGETIEQAALATARAAKMKEDYWRLHGQEPSK